MRTVALGVGGALLLCACSGGGQNSSAAPPTVVCGTTIGDSPAGAGVTDASGQTVTVRNVSAGNAIYLRVSDDCNHGVTPIFPAAAATVVTTAKAKDGLAAAIVLEPHRKAFDVQVGDHLVRVRLNVLT